MLGHVASLATERPYIFCMASLGRGNEHLCLLVLVSIYYTSLYVVCAFLDALASQASKMSLTDSLTDSLTHSGTIFQQAGISQQPDHIEH